MPKTILLTNGGGSFGLSSALTLGKAGHTVFVGLHRLSGPAAETLLEVAREGNVDLRLIELDVLSQPSVDAAVAAVIQGAGRIEVLVHNSGYLLSGRAEAFTAEQLARLYGMNVLSTQSVNRAVIPQFRRQQDGLIVWVSSISSAGSIPPYLAPYFSKASMDSVASIYARELAEAGIDCCTVLPRWSHGMNRDGAGIDPTSVAAVIATIVNLPARERPLRVFVHCRDAIGVQPAGRKRPHATVRPVLVPVPEPGTDLCLTIGAVHSAPNRWGLKRTASPAVVYPKGRHAPNQIS